MVRQPWRYHNDDVGWCCLSRSRRSRLGAWHVVGIYHRNWIHPTHSNANGLDVFKAGYVNQATKQRFYRINEEN